MTKEALVKLIVDCVQNADNDEKEAIEAVSGLIDVLTPRDRFQFASWGYPEQRSNPFDCWPEQTHSFTEDKKRRGRII